ncbi:hypothetical protein KI387_015117, partial [Taxus chinensis]
MVALFLRLDSEKAEKEELQKQVSQLCEIIAKVAKPSIQPISEQVSDHLMQEMEDASNQVKAIDEWKDLIIREASVQLGEVPARLKVMNDVANQLKKLMANIEGMNTVAESNLSILAEINKLPGDVLIAEQIVPDGSVEKGKQLEFAISFRLEICRVLLKRMQALESSLLMVQKRIDKATKPFTMNSISRLVALQADIARFGPSLEDVEACIKVLNEGLLQFRTEKEAVAKTDGRMLNYMFDKLKVDGAEGTVTVQFKAISYLLFFCKVNPGLAKGLKQLLEFDGDVEETFCRSFQVSVQDILGEVANIELKENGSDISVTKENRKEYVDLCVKYYLETSIASSFEAFKKGFQKLWRGRILQLFRPAELEQLICGSPVLDFEALEKCTIYEDGYRKDSRIVREFWEIVHSLDEENRKKLLFFSTGSDRAPIKGLANLRFVISRNGSDSDRLPTAHTCFNHLLLPDYRDKDK